MDAGEKHTETSFITWYEDVCTEYLSMLEAEEAFKRRISELEESSSKLLKAFEEVQLEVTTLRSKYEHPDDGDVYKEPYTTVYTERQTLLKAEKGYKKKIKSLQKEIRTLQEYIKGLEIEKTETVKTKNETNQKHKASAAKTNKEKLQFLEEENRKLKFNIKDIEYDIMFLRDQYGTFENKLKHLESVSSQTYAHQRGVLHEVVKGKERRVEERLPTVPKEYLLVRQNNGQSGASYPSSARPLPSIRKKSSTPGLMVGGGYRTIHKGTPIPKLHIQKHTCAWQWYNGSPCLYQNVIHSDLWR